MTRDDRRLPLRAVLWAQVAHVAQELATRQRGRSMPRFERWVRIKDHADERTWHHLRKRDRDQGDRP